jgi:pimeloyl-ACP methyl ester carboxylesterase
VRKRLPGNQNEAVVLVHGLWMKGWCMRLLAWRLRRAGFQTYCFSYASVGATLKENARQLQATLQTLPHKTIHLVGHSLGGIVIRALFHFFPSQPPGRIVTLAAPHGGSAAARQLARGRFGGRLLGKSILEIVAGIPDAWTLPAREIGTVGGSRAFGVGRLVATLAMPNDGTVAETESRLRGAQDHLVLPVTHTSIITSRRVGEAVACFLRCGRFVQPPGGEKQRSR